MNTGNNPVQVFLQELNVTGITNLDSAVTNRKGSTSFSLAISQTGFYILTQSGGGQLILVIHPGDEIRVAGDLNTLPDAVRIHGSPESDTLLAFYQQSNLLRHKFDSLQHLLFSFQDDPDYYAYTLHFDTLFHEIWIKQQELEKRFIHNHPSSFASILVMDFHFGIRPVLSLEDNLPYFLQVDRELLKKFPDNKHVSAFHQRIVDYQHRNELKKIEIPEK